MREVEGKEEGFELSWRIRHRSQRRVGPAWFEEFAINCAACSANN